MHLLTQPPPLPLRPLPTPQQDESPVDSGETAYLDCQEELGYYDATADSSVHASGYSSYGAVASAAGTAATTWRRRSASYGPLYVPTVYQDCNTPAALHAANEIMAGVLLPGAWGVCGHRQAACSSTGGIRDQNHVTWAGGRGVEGVHGARTAEGGGGWRWSS